MGMDGVEDFSDVSFGDAVINLGGKGDTPPVTNEGAKGDSPPPGAKPVDSPPADADKKVVDKPVEGAEKPLPYDQDPKWKAARAAEKTLQDTLTRFGFKTADEMAKALEHGTGLKSKLGDRDVEQLLKDADELAKAREKQDVESEKKRREGETAEQTITRLERKMALKEREFASKEEARVQSAKSQAAIKNFDDAVLEEVRGIQEELPNGAKQLIAHLLGVQNPVNDMEIEDLGKVRATTKSTINKVISFVKGVQQKAIDDYAAGKSKLTVSQPKPNTPAPNTPDTTKKPIPQGASVDEVFNSAQQDLARILLEGMKTP